MLGKISTDVFAIKLENEYDKKCLKIKIKCWAKLTVEDNGKMVDIYDDEEKDVFISKKVDGIWTNWLINPVITEYPVV